MKLEAYVHKYLRTVRTGALLVDVLYIVIYLVKEAASLLSSSIQPHKYVHPYARIHTYYICPFYNGSKLILIKLMLEGQRVFYSQIASRLARQASAEALTYACPVPTTREQTSAEYALLLFASH